MQRFSSSLIITTLVFFATTSFGADASHAEKLQSSLKTWQQIKKKCGGNYSYSVRWSSFAGFGHTTEIVVRNNKVTERKFKSFNNRPVSPVAPGQPQPKDDSQGWTESGKELGSHKQGAAPKTLDELYAEAEKVTKQELPQHLRRYVRFDKQGLLLSCFTVDTRIADDAPTVGVNISTITIAETKGGKGTDEKVYTSPSGKPFPKHWGPPPRLQTRDLRRLPGDYGRGSGTLAKWIQKNMDNDAEKKQNR